MNTLGACQRCGAMLRSKEAELCPACLMELGLRSFLEPGTRLGPYEILEPIGAGGMGEVYRARDERLKREVAIKVLPGSFSADPNRLQRFEKEAQAASALNHPNIMSIYDVGSQDGTPYIVCELLEGHTLRHRMTDGRLPVRKVVDYAAQVARGLAAAHSKGIVHRDLKPENLFVTNAEHVKILDFGIASWRPLEAGAKEEVHLTEPGTVMGTTAYMSPEQVKGQAVDGRSDIFSFGAILYEMLSGEQAFRRDSAAETMAAILKEEPPELSESGRTIPPALDQIVRHCLEKDPQSRFQSASDIAFNLSGPSSPIVTSGPLFAASPAGKRKVLAASAVLLAVALAAVFLLPSRRHSGAVALNRVAVLPFENLGAAEDDYFADGIADAVRGKLTSLPGIQVIARASSTPYKKTAKTPAQIAQELDVRYLLTATVRWQKRTGGASRVEVSPELMEVPATGAPTSKWQQPFDAFLTDVFEVQSDIATQVARSLGAALGAGETKRLAQTPTANLDAYDAFLKGEDLWNQGNADVATLRQMSAFYEQAVALDPGFAQAWAKVSESNSLLHDNAAPTPQMVERAREAAEKALSLAPDRPEGHVALGYCQMHVFRDYESAMKQLEKARRIAPGDAEILRLQALAEDSLGRWSVAVEHLKQAAALDPRSKNISLSLGDALLYLRRYGEARKALDQGLALAPGNLDLIDEKAITFALEGDLAKARAVLNAAARSVDPATLVAFVAYVGDFLWILDERQRELLIRLPPSAFDNRADWALALVEAYALKRDSGNVRTYAEEARRAFEEQLRLAPQDSQRHVSLGLALAYLGRKDDAIREGERAVALTPISRDAQNGAGFQHFLARIYVLVGEPEKALDHLEPLLKIPYWMSPASLRIDPNFDPLRGNPRFQKLLAAGG